MVVEVVAEQLDSVDGGNGLSRVGKVSWEQDWDQQARKICGCMPATAFRSTGTDTEACGKESKSRTATHRK